MASNISRFWETGKKIVCVGRNYVAHAKELNNAVPSQPFFFLKPTSSYILPPGPIVIPFQGCDMHHEIELGVVIGKKCKNLTQEEAMNYVGGYTLALDLTARCLQNAAKKQSLPWTAAKGYDTFCPISGFIEKEKIADPQNINLILKVDGEIKQEGNTNLMIFRIPQLLESISKVMTLEPGDVLLTGTPEGVGPLKPNSVVQCTIPGVVDVEFKTVAGY